MAAAVPARGTQAVRDGLQDGLRRCGFDEAGCAQRLAMPSMRDVMRRLQAHRLVGERSRSRPVDDEGADPLDLAIALLLFSRRIARGRLEDALGAETVAALLQTGLVGTEGAFLSPNVLLFPCQGLLLATDRLECERGVNTVMPLFAESHDLGALAVRRPLQRSLDLCTGSGIHALLASRHAREAVGVDISPRAIVFAEFNAWLNGVTNVRFLQGDLYAPLPPGERYGLLTANPPYNPEVASAAGEDYHSGGESGEVILAAIVAGLPRFLAEDGHCQIITLLIHRQDDPLEARIRGWLGSEGGRFDVLLLARDVDYRPLVLKGGKLSPEDQALQESWKRQRITRFQFGLLNLRRAPEGAAPFFFSGPFGDQAGPGDLRIEAAFEAVSGAAPDQRQQAGLAALGGHRSNRAPSSQ